MVAFLILVLLSPMLSSIVFLNYWDEAACLFCLGIAVYKFIRKPTVKMRRITTRINILVVVLVVIGLLGNYLYMNQSSVDAIFRDIIGCIKFPVIFYTVYTSKVPEYIWEKRKTVIHLLSIFLYIVTALGLVSIFIDIGMSQNEIRNGIRPFMFLAGHPTTLAVIMVMMLGLILMYEEQSGKNHIKQYIAITNVLILTMRTKAIMLVTVFWFLKYSYRWARRFKYTYWLVVAGVLFAAAYSKLAVVFSWSSSGRLELYLGSLNLMQMYFPIGSGFGTYASHISGKFLSDVYSFIYVAEIFSATGEATPVLGDTGLPYYFGQFGVLGTAVFVLILYYFFKISYRINTGKLCALIIFIYIVVALTSESILLNNGSELAIIMGICAKSIGNNEPKKSNTVKNVNSNLVHKYLI